MNNIQIHRPGVPEPLLTLSPDDSFVLSARQMGEQNVRLTVSAAAPLDLRAGDYLEWDGTPYSLPGEPDYKHADGTYSYDLTFQSPGHRLSWLLYKDEGSLTFPYDGNLGQQLDALYTSIGREASGFTVEIEESIGQAAEIRHIEFDKTYCLDALTRICEAFGTEWRIDGLRIRVGRWKTPAAGEFCYGRGKGLYSLEKIGVSNTSIVTRLYGFGSSDNLPAGYRAQNLVFSGEGGHSCLEKNTALYGIREEVATFDDIYPHLTDARLSAVAVPADIASAGSWTVTLSLPDDCSDLELEKDREARIKFTSGALMGEAFSITRIDPSSRQIDFNTSDDNGYKLPSPTRQPAVGDQFVLLGIVMPQSYVDLAEAALKARTQEELDRRCEKNCAYRLDIDPRYVRRQGIRVEVGGTVLVRESDSAEPVEIRVSELSYPLREPGRLSLVLSDTPVYTSYAEKVENDIKDVTHDVDNVHREARAFSRRAWRDAAELAEMLETLKADLLLVGNHTGQFVVSSVFTANRGNNPDLFHATEGQLRHTVHKGASDGVWYLGEANLDLPAATACYLYAQCSRTGTFAQYRVSAAPIGVEEQDGWYHFPVGIISSPFEGARVFNTTYGFTQIAGGTVTTGKLQASVGRNYFDLDNGAFRVGNDRSSLAWDPATSGGRLDITNADLSVLSADGTAAPFVVDGSTGAGHLAKGALSWSADGSLTATRGMFQDVILSGTFRNAFRDGKYTLSSGGGVEVSTPGLHNNNNVVVQGGSGWDIVHTMPFSKDFNGFRAVIVNERYNSDATGGPVNFNAPSGYAFFENGRESSRLTVKPFEGVEILGFGDDHGFRGWLVLNRFYTRTQFIRGVPAGVLYSGVVNAKGQLERLQRFDDDTVTAERIGTGRYRIHFRTPFTQVSNYEVMLTGRGGTDEGCDHLYACCTSKTLQYFEVYTGDDASANNGSFLFQVLSTADWETL